MAWLVDTNVLAELRRPTPDAKVVDFVSRQPLDQLFASVVTVAEIRLGIERVADATCRAELYGWLTTKVRPLFRLRTLPITEDVMLRCRILAAAGRNAGHQYSQAGLIIAATAHQHGLTVVTRDRADYDAAGVPVRNPWEAL